MKIIRILFKLLIALVVVVGHGARPGLLAQQHAAGATHRRQRTRADDSDGCRDASHAASTSRSTHGCTDCHDKDLGGRVLVDAFPIGRLAAPNLTRGKGGVGARLDAASMERAIRHGLGEGGRLLLYMPTTDFNALTDADTADLIAYVSAAPPVDRDIPRSGRRSVDAHTVRARQGAAGLRAAASTSTRRTRRRMTPAATAEYGRYLANGCTGCHGEHFSGGRVPGTPPSFPPARNITPDPANGIGKWSKGGFLYAPCAAASGRMVRRSTRSCRGRRLRG